MSGDALSNLNKVPERLVNESLKCSLHPVMKHLLKDLFTRLLYHLYESLRKVAVVRDVVQDANEEGGLSIVAPFSKQWTP